jgi:hypothetical protein
LILVDTSVWVQHLREGNEALKALLENGDVLCLLESVAGIFINRFGFNNRKREVSSLLQQKY